MNLLFDLSKEQKTAVETTGHVLLTACPGSGKTRVLTRKIAWELERLPSPQKQVIALTYTIRAAEEIERRLQSMDLDISRLWTGNIHAFCLNWILRPYGCFHPSTKSGFLIIDENKSLEIIDALRSKYGFLAWESIIPRSGVDGVYQPQKAEHAALLNEYNECLIKNSFVDFDKLLYYSLDLLRKYPKIAKTLSNLFHIILVDEYQDTHELQYQIIYEIVRAGQGKTSMFLVGDRDQAIYSSLGGIAKTKDEIVANIEQDVQVLSLPGNYRSNQRIIDFYRNFQSAKIEITAMGLNASKEGKITLNNSVLVSNTANEVARLISERLAEGIPEEEICILVPQWMMALSIAKKLRLLLPDVNFNASGISPMSKNRDNIFYKISRLFLSDPSPSLYSTRIHWAKEILIELNTLTFDGLDSIPPKTILRLANSINSGEKHAVPYLQDCLSQFLEKLRLDFQSYPVLKISWESYFSGLVKRITNQNNSLSDTTEQFKSFYREAKGVVISSCHGAKGEEYEVVISYGLLHGLLPHFGDVSDRNIDEVALSRRLLYVISSRAKNYLHLITEQERRTAKGYLYMPNHQLTSVNFNYDV
jgi:superfamily I DNA/RNA helicase